MVFRPLIDATRPLRELSPDVFAPTVVTSDLLRFEMTDAGNIHLYATIDGQERRRVFTKRNKQYEAVLEAMKPSIDIVDSIKASSMTKIDELI